MKKITQLAGLMAVATVLLADLAFAEHSPERVQAGTHQAKECQLVSRTRLANGSGVRSGLRGP